MREKFISKEHKELVEEQISMNFLVCFNLISNIDKENIKEINEIFYDFAL